jgi:hypothetical protein
VSIGLLKEGHLHASLKARYRRPGDQTEVRVDGYIVDIHRDGGTRGDGRIVEIQTANFSSVARKMRDLVTRHHITLVHPVPRDRWIVKMPREDGGSTSRRRSPRHLEAADVFCELVSFPELIANPNFQVDVVLTEEETVWRFDTPKRWRRRGWIVVERRLLKVYETMSLRSRADYLSMLPPGLPAAFTTSDLAAALRRPRDVAQKMAYCLCKAGLIDKVGAQGNAVVYARSPLEVPRRRARPATARRAQRAAG